MGGVSSQRVTKNPASVGTINRFHLQYDAYSFDALETTGQTFVSDPEYDKGNLVQGELTFVWPGFFLFNLSIGLSLDAHQEEYKSNNIDLIEGRQRSAVEKFTKVNRGLWVSTPFDFFTAGLRFNQRTIYIDKDVHYSGTFADDVDTNINGIASVSTLDVGVIIPGLWDIFDLGIMYVPPTKGTIKFDYQKSGKSLDATQPFEEAGQTIVGIGVAVEYGESAYQYLFETGTTSKVDNNFLGESGEAGTIEGQLIRFAYPPFVDVSYGVRKESLFSLSLQTETISFQFPIAIGTIKLGQATIKLLDGSDTVAEVKIPKFSFNIQFGGPRSALIVKPKTKKIHFIDRL
ncbi:MAG: hypothetical protein HQM13_08635 [SAR324 cluster bacterium]|nr:hypothetical protein [SAR324 cluster bacterium]